MVILPHSQTPITYIDLSIKLHLVQSIIPSCCMYVVGIQLCYTLFITVIKIACLFVSYEVVNPHNDAN